MPEKKNQHYVPKMLLRRFGYRKVQGGDGDPIQDNDPDPA